MYAPVSLINSLHSFLCIFKIYVTSQSVKLQRNRTNWLLYIPTRKWVRWYWLYKVLLLNTIPFNTDNMETFDSKNNVIDVREVDKVYEGSTDDYDATYTIIKLVLKVLGFRMTLVDTKFARFCWNVYFWFNFTNVLTAVSLEMVNMLQTAAAGTFLDLFTMMPCVGYLSVALVKASKIKMNRPVFENLVYELRNMWPNGRIPEDEYLLVNLALHRLRLLVGAYFSCNMMLGSVFIVPVVYVYIKHLLGYDVSLILPFGYWLPFDPLQSSKYVFETVVIVMTCHCFQSALFMMAGDLLLILFLSHITTQFALLELRINKLFNVPIDDQLVEEYPLGEIGDKKQLLQENGSKINNNEGSGTRIEEDLVSIIERHLTLIRLSGDVENLYTFSLLVNFMNSSVIICFCLFCVAFVEKWNEFTYKIFFVTAISQTGILCWYGQRLLDTSTGVGEALYNCGWYIASHNMKKSILFMIQRSQKEVHITTYGFSVISLESYATILKTSWSYFTLLINMYKG